jgi:hypothetical protein
VILTPSGITQTSSPISTGFDACVVILCGILKISVISNIGLTLYIWVQTPPLVTKRVVMKVVTVHVMHGTTTSGEYISPDYYYPKEWGRNNCGKKLSDKNPA